MTQSTQPLALFDDLVRILSALVNQIPGDVAWTQVASFECDLSRVNNKIKIHETKLWMTRDYQC